MKYVEEWSVGKLRAFLEQNGIKAAKLSRARMVPLCKQIIINKHNGIMWKDGE